MKTLRPSMASLKIELDAYKRQLDVCYTYPEQLVFVGESSFHKDENSNFKSSKGNISVLAALDVKGFMSWTTTKGKFNRSEFHKGFCNYIVPLLNPFPLPRSIVILEGKDMHMYQELIDMVEKKGALVIFLPTAFILDLNPIEYQFLRLKRYIEEHCDLVWSLSPSKVLQVAMRDLPPALNIFHHCGYKDKKISF
jgi:transposase